MGCFQLCQVGGGYFIYVMLEYFVDEVFFGVEVVVDCGDVDVGLVGDLVQ